MLHDALGFLLACHCGHLIGVHTSGCTVRSCECRLDREAVLAVVIRENYPQTADASDAGGRR